MSCTAGMACLLAPEQQTQQQQANTVVHPVSWQQQADHLKNIE